MTRPRLVLVAGWGMPSRVWEPVLPVLLPYFQVTTVALCDLAGETPDDCADALAAQSAYPACWLGWSLGAQVIARLGLRHPEKVERLLLVAANPCFVQRADYPHAMPLTVFRNFSADFRHDPLGTWRRFQRLQCQGAGTARTDARSLSSLAGAALPADPSRLDRQLGWLEAQDDRDAWASLQPPVAWLGGARDSLVPAQAGIQAFGEAATVWPSAAHVPFLSDPPRFGGWVAAQAGGCP